MTEPDEERTASQHTSPGAAADPEVDPRDPALASWHRLDMRLLLTLPLVLLAPLLPTVLVMLPSADRQSTIGRTALIWLGMAALSTVLIGIRRACTRYRVTSAHFELRTGMVTRNLRTIPRDRVRSVDLTANPAQRVCGLTVVTIGTAEQRSAETALTLDAVSRGQAERLRRVLLRQADRSAEHDRADSVISSMRLRWHAYALLTFSLVATVWSALLSLFGTFRDVLASWGAFNAAEHLARDIPPWLVVALVVLTSLAIGALGALAISGEQWWKFRLTREPDRTLRVHRGLLTTRVVSLEERRLRGLALIEPLLLRACGGARLSAVTTGLAGGDAHGPERSALLPPVPHAEAERVGMRVLRQSWPVTALVRHPTAALRRRLVRAAVSTAPLLALVATLAVVDWLPAFVASALAVCALTVAAAVALNAYRNLGHQLTEEFLVIRSGSVVRRTVVLHRGGIIGWRVRQTWFQRRAGLVTLGATTAAGNGHYRIRDVSTIDGWRIADTATPGMLRAFQNAPHA